MAGVEGGATLGGGEGPVTECRVLRLLQVFPTDSLTKGGAPWRKLIGRTQVQSAALCAPFLNKRAISFWIRIQDAFIR